MNRTMKRYYLAYGSNLNIGQMASRCPGARPVGTSSLPGYELLFKGSKTGAYLTIEKAAGDYVPVAVWEVSPEDEAALDRYEGFPRFYYKKEVTLPMLGLTSGKLTKIDAFVYIMREERAPGLPSEHYLDICLRGYLAFQFNPAALRHALKRTKELMHEKSKN